MKYDENLEALRWSDQELAKHLSSKGLLGEEGLLEAVKSCQSTHKILPETIVSLNLLPKQTVYNELAGIYGVPYIDLQGYIHDPMVMSLVDERTARELDVFPLFTIGQALTVAVTDPGDITVIDRIAVVSKCSVETCLASRDDIRDAIRRAYGEHGEVKDMLATMSEGSLAGASRADLRQAGLESKESPVSRLVDLILTQAIRDRASDIHVDPDEDVLKVRFRIDGILYEIPPPPKHLHPFIISRIKVMSSMDIAESRSPQDGSFRTTIEKRTIEARVSSMPTIYGENLAIRLLDTNAMAIELEDLGIPDRLLSGVDAAIRRPHGMVILTGPTGSGKSTSLYAILSKAKSSERHIITIEDPVERRIKMVTQVQVNEKANMSFASALRSILRQDPDVIMVGEIRDPETAQLAVRAALTGHLVFSTAHTNDAPGVVTRLVNMNIEPFLVSSSLISVIGQRLCRCICSECKEAYEVAAGIRKRFQSSGIMLAEKTWRGKGCMHCRNTGYSGRIGLFELMAVTPELAELIAANVSSARLNAQARKDGMASILEDGIEKVGKGMTSVEEVLRVAELEGVADIRAMMPDKKAVRGAVREAPDMDAPKELSLDLDDYKNRMSSWLVGRGQ